MCYVSNQNLCNTSGPRYNAHLRIYYDGHKKGAHPVILHNYIMLVTENGALIARNIKNTIPFYIENQQRVWCVETHYLNR